MLNTMEVNWMLIPNWQHHSKKDQGRTLKPQALRSAKQRTKSLIAKLQNAQVSRHSFKR